VKLLQRIFCVVLLAVLVASLLPSAALAADDWDIPGGHFFAQTGGGAGKGYSVTDDGSIRFWSEFKRFGGVNAVGYPASRRFTWEGFTIQVFQRVIFQWHPDTGTVSFVNTFDRLHDLGKDDWLLSAKQTPKPTPFDEQGKTWDQIVAGRLAVLDASPAIKAKYNGVVGDPIQSNGLPTSTVTDMGNHLAVRAQRVEFQLWKQDVPWAKAGTVTVALGGDIAKEAGVLPDPGALQPGTPDELAKGVPATPAAPPTPAPTAGPAPISTANWAVIKDGEKTFKYPSDWVALSYTNGHNYVVSPDEKAWFEYIAAYNMGPGFDQKTFVDSAITYTGSQTATFGERATRTINGHTADLVKVTWSDGSYGTVGTFESGGQIFLIQTNQDKGSDASYTGILEAIIDSYTLLR
jgi:hypothetical protein